MILRSLLDLLTLDELNDITYSIKTTKIGTTIVINVLTKTKDEGLRNFHALL